MIDFDRFWAEPGCLPGLTAEETEAQLRQMAEWLKSVPGATGEIDISQTPGLFPGPGVTAEQFAEWERACGVRMPEVLRQALSRQDGGYLYDSHCRILPLAEIVSPDDNFWDDACYNEDDVPDRRLIVQFAWDDEFSGNYYLNYAKGTHEEPSVFAHYSDPGDLDIRSSSVTLFFSKMLEASDAPSVDWSETTSADVIFHETIDLSTIHGPSARSEQVLAKFGESLVFFVQEQTPDGETLTKTTLPQPLDQSPAQIQRQRPDPIRTYGLTLQPDDSEGIIQHESRRTQDDKWKNAVSHGAPICVTVESTDRGQLEALRKSLFGQKSAARAEADEKRKEELEQRMAALSPAQQQAVGIEMLMQHREQLHAAHPSNPKEMPAEVAALNDALQSKLREAERRAKELLAGQPVDPEIQRLLREMNGRETNEDE